MEYKLPLVTLWTKCSRRVFSQWCHWRTILVPQRTWTVL